MTYSSRRKINDQCLQKVRNRGKENESVSYCCSVLEAKIVLGKSPIVSIASEFVENDGEDAERQTGMSEEESKQDCELKAFSRLASKLKKAFPRLPVCILGTVSSSRNGSLTIT